MDRRRATSTRPLMLMTHRQQPSTVKPVDLMQYVRLVTRPGGLVLDPFAGTARWRKRVARRHARGARAEDKYVEHRAAHGAGARGPGERARARVKARGEIEPPGPLFEVVM